MLPERVEFDPIQVPVMKSIKCNWCREVLIANQNAPKHTTNCNTTLLAIIAKYGDILIISDFIKILNCYKSS